MSATGQGDNRARELRARLTDPRWICQSLGLDEGAKPQPQGLLIRCPWHADNTPSCSVKVGTDGTIGVHCFGCADADGDVFHLIAQARGLDARADFPRVLDEAAQLAGEAPQGAKALRPAPARGRPDREEVRQLWAACSPPTVEPAELEARGLDPAILADRELVRRLPQIVALPGWASCRRKTWTASGHRWILPMYDERGRLASTHARRLDKGAPAPKALSPAGCTLGGLVLADLPGQVLLTDREAAGGRLVIFEGVPDFLTGAGALWSDADEGAPAVWGVISGSWAAELAARIPDGTTVTVWTHGDAAGEKYRDQIVRSLLPRCVVRVVKSARDANDILIADGAAAVRQALDQAEPAQLPADWEEALLWEWVKDEKRLKPCLANAITIFAGAPAWRTTLAYNLLRDQTEAILPPPWDPFESPAGGARPGEWEDDDDGRALSWLERHHGLTVARGHLSTAIVLAAKHQRTYHPVQDFLNALRWDGRPRLDRLFCDYFGCPETAYSAAVARWWMISAVARAFKPGCKVDHCVILEGIQGKGKTSALEILAVRLEWFMNSTIAIGDKEAYQVIRGKWLVELAELDALSRAERNRVKAFLSSPQDTYRDSYGRRSRDHMRTCIFAGTTNEDLYLADASGARRFWPLLCGLIDLSALRIDRDQLWAEALHLYRQGAKWWPDSDEERALCRDEQEQRYQGDEWEPVIRDWLAAGGSFDMRRLIAGGELTIGMVLRECLKLSPDQWRRGEETRVGNILARLGWRRERHQRNGHRSYCYLPPSKP